MNLSSHPHLTTNPNNYALYPFPSLRYKKGSRGGKRFLDKIEKAGPPNGEKNCRIRYHRVPPWGWERHPQDDNWIRPVPVCMLALKRAAEFYPASSPNQLVEWIQKASGYIITEKTLRRIFRGDCDVSLYPDVDIARTSSIIRIGNNVLVPKQKASDNQRSDTELQS